MIYYVSPWAYQPDLSRGDGQAEDGERGATGGDQGRLRITRALDPGSRGCVCPRQSAPASSRTCA